MNGSLSPILIYLLISLATVASSLWIASRTAKRETRRVVVEVKRAYAEKLLRPRIERYPALYLLLSDFIKDIRANTVSTSTVSDLLRDLDQWDSANAVFLGDKATGKMHEVRTQVLPNLLSQPLTQEAIIDAWRPIAQLEIEIKKDLGIFIANLPDELWTST